MPGSSTEAQVLVRTSHELKTPLGAVLGLAHLMATDTQHPLSDDQRRRIEVIEQAGRQMLALITDLLQATSAPNRSRHS
jgi:signal transduction histidine kinase